ncbi:DUF91 domain-containing protein [Candidatus Woesearchaeota archaeon]|nr:MAG: DUF91 domain-containing protein [Candidatus Woesearchaeota archaeon]
MGFKEEFDNALKDKKVVVFSADCEIRYSGRAESFLPRGDRIIIIKSDKTLLIHQPHGNNPINYMKSNTRHSLAEENGVLRLKSENPFLKEYLDAVLYKVHFFQAAKLEDSQKLQLAGSEKDMSDMIYNNPELIEEGFKPLTREEHTKYGFIDVFGYDKNNNLVVVECKRYTGDLQAVTQLRRYVEKIKKAKGLQKVRGILACPKISPNALKMLTDWNFSYKRINPPKKLDIDKAQLRMDEFN